VFPVKHELNFYTLFIRISSDCCKQQAEVIKNQENEHFRSTGQGEARHRKYKKLKLVGDQAYDRSSDYAAVVA
jgi:hypothetical protein